MFCKTFGERNTGTRFLNQLISINTDLQVIGQPPKDEPRKRQEQLIKKHFGRNSPIKRLALDDYISPLIENRLIDKQMQSDFDLYYGWKHARVNIKKVMASSRYGDTVFVCLVRNPWRFVSALHRRSYNLFPKTDCTLEEFIKLPFLAHERDELEDIFITNPVDLWNQKVRSYFDFAEASERVIIAYYEDVVADAAAFLNKLSGYCALAETTTIPSKSTKKDDKSFEQYREEAINYDPKAALGSEIYDQIYEKLDKEVLQKTKYHV